MCWGTTDSKDMAAVLDLELHILDMHAVEGGAIKACHRPNARGL